ncbi:MAG TPA: hypothetical protein DCY32_01240, partial [Opitutae bacterium]|nr:hypothetical protein [Opitutae bacterium]
MITNKVHKFYPSLQSNLPTSWTDFQKKNKQGHTGSLHMPDTPDKQEPQKNELTVRRVKVKNARALSLMRMRKSLSLIR